MQMDSIYIKILLSQNILTIWQRSSGGKLNQSFRPNQVQSIYLLLHVQ